MLSFLLLKGKEDTCLIGYYHVIPTAENIMGLIIDESHLIKKVLTSHQFVSEISSIALLRDLSWIETW